MAAAPLAGNLVGLMTLWALAGFGFSLTQTPIGRILNRSADVVDRPALFAAQFALSHACWLVTYPLAGWLGAGLGLSAVALVLAGLGAAALVLTLRLWPARDPEALEHDHPDLAPGHPHLQAHGHRGAHRHRFVIDDLHRMWPGSAR